MTWVHPFFLLGLLAVAIPIVLHLFGRRPEKDIWLPTIELLRKAIESRRSRSRFRELLLLLLRTAFIVLITLAVARPLISSGKPVTTAPTGREIAILIDNSLSMTAVDDGESFFARAKTAAEQIVQSIGPQDRAMLIPVVEVERSPLGWTNDRTRLLEELKTLGIGYEAGLIPPRLGQIASERSKNVREGEIWILTDGCAQAWKSLGGGRKSTDPLFIVDVRRGLPLQNHTVRSAASTNAFFDTELTLNITARFGATGDENLLAHLDVLKDSEWQEKNKQFIVISEGNERKSNFLVEVMGGDVAGRIRLERDALEVDNVAYFVASAPARLRVLLVNGSPRPEPREDAAYFLRSALDPKGGGEGAYQVTERTPDQWVRPDLSKTDVVFLADAAHLLPEQVSDLARFVTDGGGLLIGVGDSFQDENRLRTLSPLFPSNPRVIRTADANQPFRLKKPAANSSLGFLAENWEPLFGKAKFERILLMDAAPAADTLLQFQEGFPALVVQKRGEGTVGLWTSTWGRAWNDAVVAPAYPTLLRYLTFLVSHSHTRERKTPSVQPGGSLIKAADLGLENAEPFGIQTADGKSEKSGRIFAEGWRLPHEPGLWRLQYRQNRIQKSIWVVTEADASEFDLSTIRREDVESALKPEPITWLTDVSGFAQAGVSQNVAREEWTGKMALAAFFILFAESLIAGRLPARFRRRRLARAAGVFVFVLLGLNTSAQSLGEESTTEIARVEYSGGNNLPYVQPLEYLFQRIGDMTNVKTKPKMAGIKLSDSRLFDYPFLYWTGDREFSLPSEAELIRLRHHLSSGGFLWIDNALGRRGTSYESSVISLIGALFPGKSLQALPKEHAVYRSFYLLDRAWGRRSEEDQTLGIDLDRRTVILYTPGDTTGALAQDAAGRFIHADSDDFDRTMVLRFAINVLFYALTLDYKQDQIHLPFILERRG
ncbi:MAG TPA: DUF4159 domain-containing protein [Bdellovibrionota bacterium]|nr:DUF4159 domain-containing protein [Bdellovibrionota bacterium]